MRLKGVACGLFCSGNCQTCRHGLAYMKHCISYVCAQSSMCVYRQRHRGGNQRGSSYERNEKFFNRGSSADRYPKHVAVPHRDGSSERSDQQDRFGQRRFNRDSDRSREMGRGRRMDRYPGKDPTRPLMAARQPSANSTVSASRGADGRIEIAAEPASAPSVAHPSESSLPAPRAQVKVPAAKPTLLPSQTSPTSPLPAAVHSDALDAPAVPAASDARSHALGPQQPAHSHAVQAGQINTLVSNSPAPVAAPAAQPGIQSAVPPQHGVTSTEQPPAARSSEQPQKAEAHVLNSTLHPAPAPPPHSLSTAIPMEQSPAQNGVRSPTAPRHPQVSSPVPDQGVTNGAPIEAAPPRLASFTGPLQQIPPYKPKAVPGQALPSAQLPNGYPGHQAHQQSGAPPALPGLNGRSRPFTPQQGPPQHQPQLPHQQHQQQHQQQQPPQQFQQQSRRQLETPGQIPYNLGPDPRQVQGQGMPAHMLSSQPHAADSGLVPAGQGRVMHQPHPGAPRSSSIGQKRPMPNTDAPGHSATTHQFASPQQQRGPQHPSGPPIAGGPSPFNGQMLPFMAPPNGMPNASMPGGRGPNGLPFMMHSTRPSLMHSAPLTNSINIGVGKSVPPHQHGGASFGANPYMQMQHMPNHLGLAGSHGQGPRGPHPIHSGPEPHPQAQPTPLQAPAYTPPQRALSSSASCNIPNGHIRPSQTAALSPASSLGNSAKGSSTLRATAMPFVPGGMAQPSSPIISAHSTPPAGPFHDQASAQRGPRQLQSGAGMASAAPFYPSSELTGEALFASPTLSLTAQVSHACFIFHSPCHPWPQHGVTPDIPHETILPNRCKLSPSLCVCSHGKSACKQATLSP